MKRKCGFLTFSVDLRNQNSLPWNYITFLQLFTPSIRFHSMGPFYKRPTLCGNALWLRSSFMKRAPWLLACTKNCGFGLMSNIYSFIYNILFRPHFNSEQLYFGIGRDQCMFHPQNGNYTKYTFILYLNVVIYRCTSSVGVTNCRTCQKGCNRKVIWYTSEEYHT